MGYYRHGDLRRAMLDVTMEALAETGEPDLSLRALTRRFGACPGRYTSI